MGNFIRACCIAVELTSVLAILAPQRRGQVFGLDGVILHRILAHPVWHRDDMGCRRLNLIERRRHLERDLLEGIDAIHRVIIRRLCRRDLVDFQVVVAIKYQIIVFAIIRSGNGTIAIHRSGAHENIASVGSVVEQCQSTPYILIAVKVTCHWDRSRVCRVWILTVPYGGVLYMVVTREVCVGARCSH